MTPEVDPAYAPALAGGESNGDRGTGRGARPARRAAAAQLPRPSRRSAGNRLHRGVRALLLLRHADFARALHGEGAAAFAPCRADRGLRLVQPNADLAL